MGEKERESMSATRLQQVEDALLSGRSHAWCMEVFSRADDAGGWGVTPRQVQNYIARVEAKWRERTASPERREEARERCLMLLRKYADSEVPGAAGAACKAADMLNKIDGCYAPVEIKHSGEIGVRQMTPLQRRQKLAELEAKRAAAAGATGRPH
jgi:hypothetical protein